MNIVIPLAGRGTRVTKDNLPKPLVDILGKPMIQQAVESLDIDGRYYFVTRKYDDPELNERLNEVLFECTDDPIILTIDYETDGPAISASLPYSLLNPREPLIVTNCDQYMLWDSQRFLDYCTLTDADGVVVTYNVKTEKNSYIELDEEGWGVRVVEKEIISDHSLNGIHYWKRAIDFFQSVVDMIHSQDTVNGEYYIGPTYNYMINNGQKVCSYPIKVDQHWAIGTDEDIDRFLEYMHVHS